MNLLAGQEQRSRCREWTCGHREGKKGGMNSESSIDVHFTECKTDSQWEAAVQHRELNLLLCDDLDGEGWDEEAGEREAQEGGERERERYIYIYIYIVTSNSHCCTAETNTTL